VSEPTQQDPSDIPDIQEEENLDLSRLETELNSVLTAGRAPMSPDDVELEPVRSRRGRRRSPLLSLVVVAVGGYLLSALWSDFCYWLESPTPRDIGVVTEIYNEGQFVEDYNNQHVVFTGTPDVQHAARVPVGDAYMGFLRVGEAEGSLFAAIPRASPSAPATFETRFSGRMIHLDQTAIGEPLREFFDAESIGAVIDVEVPSLLQALGSSDASAVAVIEEKRTITIDSADTLRVVTRSDDAVIQLGRATWRRRSEAEAAVAALGLPYVATGRDDAPYWSFRVRMPAGQHDAHTAALLEGHDVPSQNADPKVGAMILARTTSYRVEPRDLSVANGRVTLVYGKNTSGHGYEAIDGRLVEKKLEEDGRLSFSIDEISAIRVERTLSVDPGGYVVMVGDKPEKHRLAGTLFAVVCGLMGLNLFSLVVLLRRRRAGRTDKA